MGDNEDRHSINTAKMVRYAATHIDSAKSARARGSYLRVSYKNTRETAQAINRWKLERAVSFLENAEANADTKGLDTSNLIVKQIQVNQPPKQRRRTYRAHGRINPYMSNPSHIELILTEGEEVVQKAPQAIHREQGLHHLTSRQRGQRRKMIQGASS